MCSLENPLGLPIDDQGRAHQLRVEIIGADPGERRSAYRALCDKLRAISNGATTLFNNLTQAQQVIAILLREDWRHPHRVLEHYLQAPPEFRDIAIVCSEYYTRNRDIVLIELAEARIAGYLIEGVSEGRPERLGTLSVEAEAGGGISNNEGDWVDTKSPAYKHWDWNWKKGFVTVRAMMVHKMWSWGLPLDARGQAPLREIGEILKQ